MSTAPLQIKIPVNNLLVDTQNPRLPKMQTSQGEAIQLMVQTQGSKILSLAQHLADNGTNPASLPIVIPATDEKGKYYVLDGNRRLSALRLLEHPELGNSFFNNSALQKIKELAVEYKKRPITHLECVVFSTREQADPWIQLIHRGESQGAGLVEWDGQVAARYDERKGIGEKSAPAALQILDLVKDQEKLSQKTHEKIENGKFPITSLTRLVNTPYVRKKIGLQVKKGVIDSLDGRTIKYLTQIVDDLGTEYKTVSDIKRLVQRIEYIDTLFDPRPTEKDETSEPKSDKSASVPVTTVKKRKVVKKEKIRTTLIPKEFLAEVTHPRINNIFVELKKLNVDEFPNAASVMLRVFLELSLDHFLEENMKWSEQQIGNSKLAQKLLAVAKELENNQVMSSSQLAPIRKAAGGQTLLAASVLTLHGYVHSRYFSPIPSELKTAWNDMELFISNLWPI